MDQSFHCVYAVERFVGEAIQVMVIHLADSDCAFEALRLDIALRLLNVAADNINGLKAETSTSQMNGNMTDSTSSIKHVCADFKSERVEEVVFHRSQCFADRERPPILDSREA